ncbi:MAG: hypothetical protein K1X68_05015 [Saprospiraceae bacterium]|nr:hypothetical protein [Saprospiraceae bacterium]HMW39929.1 DUF6371 domain-containing protein [Saprospiraceae bacterium]HMZ39409.1 DUF6371 domain-containing protein [Saprospiraceae bacterium]HNB30145.1 DUF6371 domain-containing protein [Saprospiraceae bacterium]HNE61390.1 DUF6371 domain-containing protein [Saprospiraceae bacterium]
MSNNYRYTLEPYKGMNTRYHCPYCNHKDRKFVRYIDTETGEHLAEYVGRCERIDSCGAHYKPKDYFQDNNYAININKSIHHKNMFTIESNRLSLIPEESFKASLKGYESNNFVKFLIEHFGMEITNQLIKNYFIGSSKHWQGSSIFWQVDIKGKVRSGKIMRYNAATGKRIREPFDHITWVHSVLKLNDFKLCQCLFGEHLLVDKSKPVAIVESEKTAIIASVYLPQFIWLAVGGKRLLSRKICQILQDRSVLIFPDLNAYDDWNQKAKEFSDIGHFQISDLLQRNATEAERNQGFDLADYLIKYDYKQFQIEP